MLGSGRGVLRSLVCPCCLGSCVSGGGQGGWRQQQTEWNQQRLIQWLFNGFSYHYKLMNVALRNETWPAASVLKRHKRANYWALGFHRPAGSIFLYKIQDGISHQHTILQFSSARCINFIKFTWLTGCRLCRDLPLVAQDHIYTNSVLMAKLSANFPLLFHIIGHELQLMPQTLLGIWQPRTLLRLKRAEQLMWCQWTCQSNLFSSAMGQRPEHWAYTHYISHMTRVPVLCLQLLHLCSFFPLCLSAHLSSLSLFIPLHFLPYSVPSHRFVFCSFSFSFIKRSAHVVHTLLHPALVSLRARVGGKSGFVVFMHPLASPWVKLDEMCFA